MKLISINLPQELLTEAKQVAHQQSISLSALIRLAVISYLKEQHKNA